MRSSNSNSIPKLTTFDGKFCLPTPKTMTGVYSTAPYTAAVTSIAMDGPGGAFALVTTTANHNMNAGDLVVLSGNTTADYNGIFKIRTVGSLTTFTIAMKVGTAASGGTILFQDFSQTGIPLGCLATGIGTLAGTDFQEGDWLYDEGTSAVRQVVKIWSATSWTFSDNFASNMSGITVKLAATGTYRGISIQNTGADDGIIMGITIANDVPAMTWWDEEGLDPVCGDATDTTFTVGLQLKAPQ